MTDKGMPDFMELVEQMRRAQKQYFRALRGSTEQKHWLMESKRLESKVDAEIVRFRQGQMDLFGGTNGKQGGCRDSEMQAGADATAVKVELGLRRAEQDDDKWYPQDKYNAYDPAQNMSEISGGNTQNMSEEQKRPSDASKTVGQESTRAEPKTKPEGRISSSGRTFLNGRLRMRA